MAFWFLPYCCFSLTTADLQTELSQPGPRSLEKASNPINSPTDDLVVHDPEGTRATPKLRFKKTNKSMLKKNHGDNSPDISVLCARDVLSEGLTLI